MATVYDSVFILQSEYNNLASSIWPEGDGGWFLKLPNDRGLNEYRVCNDYVSNWEGDELGITYFSAKENILENVSIQDRLLSFGPIVLASHPGCTNSGTDFYFRNFFEYGALILFEVTTANGVYTDSLLVRDVLADMNYDEDPHAYPLEEVEAGILYTPEWITEKFCNLNWNLVEDYKSWVVTGICHAWADVMDTPGQVPLCKDSLLSHQMNEEVLALDTVSNRYDSLFWAFSYCKDYWEEPDLSLNQNGDIKLAKPFWNGDHIQLGIDLEPMTTSSEIALFTFQGRRVSIDYQDSFVKPQELLPAGIYFLKVGNQVFTIPKVKEKLCVF
jgi:hypothetical protein